MNSIEYLDAVKARYGWISDYKLAKELGVSRARMSTYRNEKSGLGEDLCLKVADLLNLPPEQVLLDVYAERTKSTQAAQILKKLSHQIGAGAAAVFLALSMTYATLGPAPSHAAGMDAGSYSVYYVK